MPRLPRLPRLRRSLLALALLLATIAAVPPGGCSIFTDVCGCSGDLQKIDVSGGRYAVITSVSCPSPATVTIDHYRKDLSGRETHLELCRTENETDHSCVTADPGSGSSVDYYRSSVLISRGSCAAGTSLYNGT